MELYLATKKGFITAVRKGDQWEIGRQGLNGRYLTTIIAREGVILAGTQDGILRSDDHGHTWRETSQGLHLRHVRWLAYHPDISDLEFAGTEPASIFVSQNGGESWQERPEIPPLRHQLGWWLPYSPEAGCVRGFAFHGQRAYAAVEVGTLLRSDDGGLTWRVADARNGQSKFGYPPPSYLHPDVHSVAVHPTSADLVYAPTGGGFYHSDDGGHTWQILHDEGYVRAVWLDPQDPNHMILGPADGPSGKNGRIEQTHDGGLTWQAMTESWSHNMVERFHQVADTLWAVMSNGSLLMTPLSNSNWHSILPQVQGINDLTSMN